jgi:hypothetical protein
LSGDAGERHTEAIARRSAVPICTTETYNVAMIQQIERFGSEVGVEPFVFAKGFDAGRTCSFCLSALAVHTMPAFPLQSDRGGDLPQELEIWSKAEFLINMTNQGSEIRQSQVL